MAKKIKSRSELFKFLEKKIEETLADNVADQVRHEEQIQIERVVYDSYDPFEYSRRRYNENGLQDREMMVAAIERRGNHIVLSVVNEAKGQNQEDLYLAPLIEYGDGAGHGEYQYKYNRDGTAWKYLGSRPFTEATIKALKESKKHIEAMKEGLRERGIKSE